MTHRTSLRSLLFFAFITVLALGVSPLLAQDAAPLSQSAHISADGLTLTISYPAGWVEDASPQNIFLASNAAALDQIKSGLVTAPGQVGIVAYLPGFLDNLSLPHNADPTKVVTTYEQLAKVTGDVQTSTDYSVPAATAVVASAAKPTDQVLLGALAFPTGTVVFGATPSKAVDSTVTAVINSITLTSDQGSPQATEQTRPPVTEQIGAAPTVFNVSQPNGSFQLSITLPDGWVDQYDANVGQLSLANSQSALEDILHSNNMMAAGDMGISLVLPSALPGLGLTMTSDPNTVLTTFESQAKVTGEIQTDISFSVPTGSAVVTGGNMPSGGAAVYALAFDGGTIFLGVLPASADDQSMQAILHSIRFAPASAAQATPETQATQASGANVTLTPTTFDVDQPNGKVELSLGLPDGWVSQNDNSGFIYVASSQEALTNIASTQNPPAPGQIGISILLPDQLIHAGVTHTDSPSAVLADFEKAFSATGQIQTDSSFAVPAAYAHLSGDKIPKGGGAVYALAFGRGILLVLVQPDSALDATILSILKTINLGAPPELPPTALLLPTETPTVVALAQVVRQWAASADGTSEYGTDNWSFAQATGKPDTTTCGDNGTAWASQDSTGRAVLQLTFTHPVIPSQINIYQTFNPGAIVEIDVGSSANPNQVLPLPNSADNSGSTACPGVFSVNVSGVTTPIDFVVIYLDQSLTQNWDEIDAVQLVGTAP